MTIAHPTTNSYTDGSRTPREAYAYRIRARNGGRISAYASPDIASTFALTDDPVTAEATPIKSVHIEELRDVIDAVRAAADLSAGSYTDATLTGVTVKAIHFTELRDQLNAALTALDISPVDFAETLTAGTTTIQKAHLDVLREGSR